MASPILGRTRADVVLSVCPDLVRLQRREHALTAAGFRVVSASTTHAATAMSRYWQFGVLVVDRECSDVTPLLKISDHWLFGPVGDGSEDELVREVLMRVVHEPAAA